MAAFGQAAPGSWAKVHLTRGQSSGGIWEIDGKYPQARITIGSDPSAGWAVQGPGVRPTHFELYWDGQHLFVADTQRAGAVMLNGVAVGADWVQVRGRGEVVFGQAAMLVETSDAAPAAPPADAGSAKRVSMVDGPSSAHSLPELSGEATRLQDSPWESGGSAVPISSEATRIQDAPSELGGLPALGVGAPSRGGPLSVGGPRIGGVGAPPPPPGSRPRLGGNESAGQFQAKTLMQDELQQSVAEATRMVSMPDNGPSIVVSPGLMPQQPMGGAPMGGPMGGMPVGGPMGGAPMGGAPMGGPPAFGAPMGPGGGSGFAAPPGYGEGGPSSGGRKLPFGLTARTAGMVGALGIAVIVLLFVGFADEEPEYVEDTATQPVPPVPPPVAPPVPPPVPQLGAPPVGVPVPPPVGVPVPPPVGVPVPPPVGVPVPPVVVAPPPVVPPVVVPPPVDPAAPPVDPSAPLPPTAERVAADLVIAGHYAEALPQYQTLAMEHPERPEYSAMIHILEARLRAAQCVNGIGPDGRPCVPGR